ncbi:E3 ubiquitin-protein ligase TRIM56-like [Ptychodera flava]|uniref:E3 ubiquitin-protein ligase TRIM56-like n=1 Tax=Ptychodera flava TaxID=63121 RepID=UPI00396A2B9E
MAGPQSARSLLNQIDEDLVCQICLERLKDARALRCQHSFCRGCLEAMTRDERMIRCPTCRDLTPLPMQGVDELPKNFHVNNLVTLMEQREKESSRHGAICDGCVEEPATTRCVDCCVLFCQSCANAHARGKYKRHAQISIDEYSQKSRRDPSYEMCEQHQDQKLESFCQSCQVATCRQCACQGHSAPNHHLLPINEALGNLFSRLEIREGKVKQRKKHIMGRRASIERMAGKLAVIHSTEKEKISSALSEQRGKVRDIMQEIIGKLERDAKQKLDTLDSAYITNSGILQDEMKELRSAELKLDKVGNLDSFRSKSATTLLRTEDAILSELDDVIALSEEVQVEKSPRESSAGQLREGALIRQESKRAGVLNVNKMKRINNSGELAGVNFMRFVPDTAVDDTVREFSEREFTIGNLVQRTVSEQSYHQDVSSCNPQ